MLILPFKTGFDLVEDIFQANEKNISKFCSSPSLKVSPCLYFLFKWNQQGQEIISQLVLYIYQQQCLRTLLLQQQIVQGTSVPYRVTLIVFSASFSDIISHRYILRCLS